MSSCNCNITDEVRRSMSVQQRQEMTVVILREFVARQQLAQQVKNAGPAPFLNSVPDELHYVDTQPGDL